MPMHREAEGNEKKEIIAFDIVLTNREILTTCTKRNERHLVWIVNAFKWVKDFVQKTDDIPAENSLLSTFPQLYTFHNLLKILRLVLKSSTERED